MFLNYYGLREQPFGVTPDLRYLYFSPGHQEALASLYYGLETGRGFLLLVAKPGMGKTTLLMQLLEQLRGSAHTVFLFQTQCTSRELLRYVLVDLGIKTPERDLVDMHEQLKEALLEAWRSGKRLVLIIDEAQGLEDAALELVRLLSNFETSHSKLMQIVMAGQPTLSSRLGHYTLDPLRQRVSIISRLQSFGIAETSKYVNHRLSVAGHAGKPLFTQEALELLATQSHGIPRIINNLCFNALSLGYAEQRPIIDVSIMARVVADLDLGGLGPEIPASVPLRKEPGQQPVEPPWFERLSFDLSGFRAWTTRLVALGTLTFLVSWFTLSLIGSHNPRKLIASEVGSEKPITSGERRNQYHERAAQFLDRLSDARQRAQDLGKEVGGLFAAKD
jgi:type II secretory pathway predicted ATPase ExeA